MWQWIMFFLLAIVILAFIEETLQYFLNKYLRNEMVQSHQRLKRYAERAYLFFKGMLKKRRHF